MTSATTEFGTVRRLDAEGLSAVAAALNDREVLARYLSKVVAVPGSECLWWTGAVSGRGHGRFWLGPRRVVIAHRFAFAVMHGVDALATTRVLGHRCDNPLCQRVAPGHAVASSALANRREWAHRRRLAGSPLNDPRGARHRARSLRDMARADPAAVAADLEQLRRVLGEQMALW